MEEAGQDQDTPAWKLEPPILKGTSGTQILKYLLNHKKMKSERSERQKRKKIIQRDSSSEEYDSYDSPSNNKRRRKT